METVAKLPVRKSSPMIAIIGLFLGGALMYVLSRLMKLDARLTAMGKQLDQAPAKEDVSAPVKTYIAEAIQEAVAKKLAHTGHAHTGHAHTGHAHTGHAHTGHAHTSHAHNHGRHANSGHQDDPDDDNDGPPMSLFKMFGIPPPMMFRIPVAPQPAGKPSTVVIEEPTEVEKPTPPPEETKA